MLCAFHPFHGCLVSHMMLNSGSGMTPKQLSKSKLHSIIKLPQKYEEKKLNGIDKFLLNLYFMDLPFLFTFTSLAASEAPLTSFLFISLQIIYTTLVTV